MLILYKNVMHILRIVIMCSLFAQNSGSRAEMQATAYLTKINSELPAKEYNNNAWTVKGVLWGDGITNGEAAYVTILIKNNSDRAIRVPSGFPRLGVEYGALVGENDLSRSVTNKYIILIPNKTQAYTYKIIITSMALDESVDRLLTITMDNIVSESESKYLNERKLLYVEKVRCEIGHFKKKVKLKKEADQKKENHEKQTYNTNSMCLIEPISLEQNNKSRGDEIVNLSMPVGTNTLAIKAVLWNDVPTSRFNFTILVKNNYEDRVMVPSSFNALLCNIFIKGSRMISHHEDLHGSEAKDYITLCKDNTHTYTYTIESELDERDSLRYDRLEIYLHNNLSDQGRKQLTSTGQLFIEDIKYITESVP